jgi:site-specific recombinase XerD
LTWDHVDLEGEPDANPPIPASIQVWRSVRVGGDTTTRKSRWTLALAERAVEALEWQRTALDRARKIAGKRWTERGVVFVASTTGAEPDAANVRPAFRRVVKLAGLDEAELTPRELHHSFVSIMSDSGVSLETIADLIGHSDTSVTEKVYRHQLRPVPLDGAQAMDKIFKIERPDATA